MVLYYLVSFSNLFILNQIRSMPEKSEEEKALMAKRLMESRSKAEGMPTTAKVNSSKRFNLFALKR